MPAKFLLALILVLTACRDDDPRIAQAEAVAEEVCACAWLGCAVEAARPLTETRGLEQEDYANLREDLITRYEAAHNRAQACVRALILE